MSEQPHLKTQSTPVVVLDTNVVLEAWVFGNQDSINIMIEVGAHNVVWLTTPDMKNEVVHVLGRGLGPRWPTSWEALQDRWASHTTECVSDPHRPANWPRCTDGDDQKFVDFALQQRARWLISRDRAVLKLAPRCARLGLTVVDPTRWQALWWAESSSSGQ